VAEYAAAKTEQYPGDILQFEKYLKDNRSNSPHLSSKMCSDICPWTLSVPRSKHFSESEARGKL